MLRSSGCWFLKLHVISSLIGLVKLQDDRVGLGRDHAPGGGLDLAAVPGSQLERELLQQVGDESKELDERQVVAGAPPLAGSKGKESLMFRHELAIGIQPMLRIKLIRLLPVHGIMVDLVEVGQDEGSLGNHEAVDLGVDGGRVHDPDWVDVAHPDQVHDQGLEVRHVGPVRDVDSSAVANHSPDLLLSSLLNLRILGQISNRPFESDRGRLASSAKQLRAEDLQLEVVEALVSVRLSHFLEKGVDKVFGLGGLGVGGIFLDFVLANDFFQVAVGLAHPLAHLGDAEQPLGQDLDQEWHEE